ncbi:hypothetical protein D3C84_1258730 [compost metagenome]
MMVSSTIMIISIQPMTFPIMKALPASLDSLLTWGMIINRTTLGRKIAAKKESTAGARDTIPSSRTG